MRRTERHKVTGANSLWHVYKTVPFWKVVRNFIVIQAARYTPFLALKSWMYKTFLGMKVGGMLDKKIDDRRSRRILIYVFIAGGISTTIYALLQLI